MPRNHLPSYWIGHALNGKDQRNRLDPSNASEPEPLVPAWRVRVSQAALVYACRARPRYPLGERFHSPHSHLKIHYLLLSIFFWNRSASSQTLGQARTTDMSCLNGYCETVASGPPAPSRNNLSFSEFARHVRASTVSWRQPRLSIT